MFGRKRLLKSCISTGRSSVDIGASANLEVVDKFSYLGDMLSVDVTFTSHQTLILIL